MIYTAVKIIGLVIVLEFFRCWFEALCDEDIWAYYKYCKGCEEGFCTADPMCPGCKRWEDSLKR